MPLLLFAWSPLDSNVTALTYGALILFLAGKYRWYRPWSYVIHWCVALCTGIVTLAVLPLAAIKAQATLYGVDPTRAGHNLAFLALRRVPTEYKFYVKLISLAELAMVKETPIISRNILRRVIVRRFIRIVWYGKLASMTLSLRKYRLQCLY